MTLVILGTPRPKGNSRRFFSVMGRPVFAPSKLYMAWFRAARLQAAIEKGRIGLRAPLAYPVSVKALFFCKRLSGDLDNYEKGLGDFLQRCGLIRNDRLVRSWDGSRLLRDPERPRVEIEIRPFEQGPL